LVFDNFIGLPDKVGSKGKIRGYTTQSKNKTNERESGLI